MELLDLGPGIPLVRLVLVFPGKSVLQLTTVDVGFILKEDQFFAVHLVPVLPGKPQHCLFLEEGCCLWNDATSVNMTS